MIRLVLALATGVAIMALAAAAGVRQHRSAAPSTDDAVHVVLAQADGRILAGGSGGFDFALARYRPDGTLDPAFGDRGRVVTSGPFADYRQIEAAAVQPDGRIVVAGWTFYPSSASDFVVARYTESGSLDKSFGRDGFVLPSFGGREEGAYGIAVQEDGKIVVVGYSQAETWDPSVWVTDFVVARYLSDGKPDVTFGAGGRVLTHFGAESGEAYAVSIQGDGKIVVAGSAGARFALARYAPDGKLDPSFGSNGKVLTAFGAKFDAAYAVRVQEDGRIVAAGQSQASGETRRDVAVARYLPDGALDPSFGSAGKVTTDFGSGTFDEAYGVVTQADGRTVVAGRTGPGTNGPFHFMVVRYLRDGALDPGFGTGGKVKTAFGAKTSDWATGLVLQPDDRIVAAGESGPPTSVYRGDFALARYLPDGSLDRSFGGDGKTGTDFARAYTQVVSFTAKRAASGVRVRWRTAWETNTRGFELMRYDSATSKQVRVGAKLIKAKGSAVRGASYTVLDRRAPKAYLSYGLREKKADGSVQWHAGPTLKPVKP